MPAISPMAAKWTVGENDVFVHRNHTIGMQRISQLHLYKETTAIGLWALCRKDEAFRVKIIEWERVDHKLYMCCVSDSVILHRIISQEELQKFLELCIIHKQQELDWRVCGF